MEYKSYTTIVIMEDLRTKLLWMIFARYIKHSHSVSPQFHCVFGDDFDTVKKEQHDTSIWQRKVHLQATHDKL